MTDYISREELENWVREEVASLDSKDDREFVIQRWRKELPAADVAPVVHAEWKINADGYYPYCSACKKEPPGRCMTAHCPNCGARMQEAK